MGDAQQFSPVRILSFMTSSSEQFTFPDVISSNVFAAVQNGSDVPNTISASGESIGTSLIAS